MDEAYQWVCTCQEDANSIGNMLGVKETSKDLLASCSEFGGAKKVEVEKKKEFYIEKIKEANIKAVNEAAHNVRVSEASKILEEEFTEPD